MRTDSTRSAAGGLARFSTTQWTVILSSARKGDEAHARAALGQLCRIYWRPIFAFIRRRGYSQHGAQDLTQDFFVMVLEGNLLQRADPAKGRFRGLLLMALRRFLADAQRITGRQKNGSQLTFVAWDDWLSHEPSHLMLSAHAMSSWPAEQVFDLRWAATVAERALSQLREECERRERRRAFEVLSGALTAHRCDISYAEMARALGVAEHVVKRVLYQMRKRYRELLRNEIALTVADESEVDDELRYLCAALARVQQQ